MVKAQIDVQFNWVFILIVGAIILSFFVGASLWYKNIQEQKITAQIVVNVESLLKTAAESPKTAQTITIPDVTLSFTCTPECNDYGCISDFSGGGVTRSTETEVLFSHSTLSGTQLIMWALEWDFPYKMANFLYVTTDSIRYIILYDDEHSSLAYAVNSLLAENSYLTKETIKVDDPAALSITNKNDVYVRIISFLDEGTLPLTTIENTLGKQQETWDIITVEGTEDKGTVVYADGDAPYTGLPLLIGALFSPTKEFYLCNMQKALLQAKIITEVYTARTKELYDSFSGTEKEYCTYYYDNSIQDAIKGIPTALENNDDVSLYLDTLEQTNQYAVMKGCPRLY